MPDELDALAKHVANGPCKPIRVSVCAGPDSVVIEVDDEGTPFDPKAYTSPKLDELPERGMGLFIVRQMTDEVRSEPGRERGNHWVLVRRRP